MNQVLSSGHCYRSILHFNFLEKSGELTDHCILTYENYSHESVFQTSKDCQPDSQNLFRYKVCFCRIAENLVDKFYPNVTKQKLQEFILNAHLHQCLDKQIKDNDSDIYYIYFFNYWPLTYSARARNRVTKILRLFPILLIIAFHFTPHEKIRLSIYEKKCSRQFTLWVQ